MPIAAISAAAGTPADFRRSKNNIANCFAGVRIGDADLVTMLDTPKQSWPWGRIVAMYHGRDGHTRVRF